MCIGMKHAPTRQFDYNAERYFLKSLNVVAKKTNAGHDDAIKRKHFPRYWPFEQGIKRSPAISPHKGQWRGALMFFLICVEINGWVNNCRASDLGRHRTRYDVIVMVWPQCMCLKHSNVYQVYTAPGLGWQLHKPRLLIFFFDIQPWFRYVIFKLILMNDGWGTCSKIAVNRMSVVLIDYKSTLLRAMAWCQQVTSHPMRQCWPRYIAPDGGTSPK